MRTVTLQPIAKHTPILTRCSIFLETPSAHEHQFDVHRGNKIQCIDYIRLVAPEIEALNLSSAFSTAGLIKQHERPHSMNQHAPA